MSQAIPTIPASRELALESREGTEQPLRIGIDAGPILGEGGISGYVRPLIKALLEIDGSSQYQFILRKSWISQEAISTLKSWGPVHPVRIPDRLLNQWWDSTNLPFPLGRKLWNELNLFLATCLVVPILNEGRTISIIYDVIPLRLPHFFPNHRTFQSQIKRVLARSQAIVTISHQTKQDLLEFFNLEEERIHVIYPGHEYQGQEEDDLRRRQILQRYSIQEPYALYVGSTGPHKNVESLLHAYEEACTKQKLQLALVMVVRSGWSESCQKIREKITQKTRLICLADVPAQDLRLVYAGAQFMVWPSLYEGFGFPVLESMASGTPVILGRNGASPEITGEDGLYVEKEDATSLAEAMCRMAEDRALRARLGIRCRERASRFSWTASARQLHRVLHGQAYEHPTG